MFYILNWCYYISRGDKKKGIIISEKPLREYKKGDKDKGDKKLAIYNFK